MKILIYTTHRTGSTSLAQLLMVHYNCDYQRGGIYQKSNSKSTIYTKINDAIFTKMKSYIKKNENIVIKLTPDEIKYELIRNDFDKCIVLKRDNIKEQAESRLYAEEVEKFFIPYTIHDSFLKEHTKELNDMEELIKTENEILDKCEDCLHITYEDLYYNDGLKKIEEYLGTTTILKLDNSNKYRNGKRNLI